MASKSIKKVTVRWKNAAGQERSAERWQARYRDQDGHQRKKNFKRKVDGDRWLDEVTTSMVTGRYVDPNAGKVTLQGFYDDWSRRQIWESNSQENADLAMKSCTFTDVPMNRIRRSHVEAWVKQMTRTLAATTIRTRFTIVRSVLRSAVTDKIIAEDPAAGVSLPTRRKSEAAMTIPLPEQVGALIASADQTRRVSSRRGFRAFVALCAFAGLRMGEALGVQVSDIDFLRHQLSVTRQVKRAKSRDLEDGVDTVEATGATPVIIRPPKYGSERAVSLPDELIDILAEHISEHSPTGAPDRWLFADAEGRPLHDNVITWRWRATRKAAALSTRLHDLRHFYASGLIATGCDVATVQQAMGHRSATTTLTTYSHLWPKAEDKTRDAASAVARQALGTSPTGRTPGAKASKQAPSSQPVKHAF